MASASLAEDRRSASAPSYARRRPEASALHEVVRDNLLTLYAAIEDGFAAPLPKWHDCVAHLGDASQARASPSVS